MPDIRWLLTLGLLMAAVPFTLLLRLVEHRYAESFLVPYLISLAVLACMVVIVLYVSRGTTRKQYLAMRADGLSEEEIRKIVGTEKYARMRIS